MNETTIPPQILDFAKYMGPRLVPKARVSGWTELDTEKRGNGDLMDLLGSMMILDELTKSGKVCRMDITCGTGDKSDIDVMVGGKWMRLNIKTSSYAPFRSGLNLYVKEEEVDKYVQGYIQCFVHLNEKDLSPHVHIVGWISTSSNNWKIAKENVITIPKTNGHKGIQVPVQKLRDISSMMKLIDDKF